METQNEMLSHAVKAIRYRFIKVTNDSADNFGDFKIAVHTRCPSEIINHMYDLAVKTTHMLAEGHFQVPVPTLLDFNSEKERFLKELNELVSVIAMKAIPLDLCKKLLQGPVLDIGTHIGQLAMLNGLNGNKIPRESYYNAVIE